MEGGRFPRRAMAFLPDLAVASLLALVVFLVALGLLVVFIESIPPARTAGFLVAATALSGGLAVLGEVGVGLVVLGLAAAVLANHAFEWLTTR